MEVAASIVGIAATAFQVMIYLKDVKDATESQVLILEEVNSLWRIFLRLEHYAKSTSGEHKDDLALEPLKELEGPEGVFAQVDKQLKQLEKQLAPLQAKGVFGRIVSRMKWPFQEKEAMRIVARLRALKNSTTLVLQQSSHQGFRGVLEGIDCLKSTLDNESFRNLLLWLSTANVRSKQKDILGQVNPSTCRILGSASFSSWRKADLRTLWIYGAHGAGKSVAAASIYKVLSEQHHTDNVFVIGSFCSHDDKESQSPRSVIASLLKQVLQARGQSEVPKELREYYSRAEEQSIDLDTLSNILRDEIKSRDGAYVIIDGLDEVGNDEDRVAMVKVIHDLGATVKIIITSRHSNDIPKAIQATQSCTQCDRESSDFYWRCINCHFHVVCERCFQNEPGNCNTASTQQIEKKHQRKRERGWQRLRYQPNELDIRNYVEGSLGSDTKLGRLINSGSASLRQETIDTITANSKNIFMLTRTHLDLLGNCLRPADVKKTLKVLKPSLPDMFEKSLERIKKNLRPNQHEILMKLFLWVSWNQRPLSIHALGHALAVHRDSESIAEDEIYPIQEYVDRSAGLLQVDSEELVRFAHETTKRFFVDHRDHMQYLSMGHGKIAHACLDYLNMKVLQEPFSGSDQKFLFFKRLAEYPLIEYAVLHSFKHVNLSPEKTDDRRAVELLLSNTRRSLIQALYYLDRNWSIETDVSAQHLAIYLGLTEVFSDLLEEVEDLDCLDEFGATALMYAAARGDSGLPETQLLLQAGASPSITCHLGSTALIRAVDLNATELVRRLVREPDIKINAVPLDAAGFSGPALVLAARSGNIAVLKLLMAREDIDMNQTDNGKPDGRTALHVAATLGNASVMRQLLTHKGVDIESRASRAGSMRWTALVYAASYGNKECAELLIDNGADINYLDCYAGNALMRAADGDYQHVANLLVDRGIDVKHKDFLGRTALHSAATNQSWATLQYFLQDVPGIDINLQDDEGGTALHDACYYLDTRSVRLLVSAGARCDLVNQKGETPVDMATSRNGFSTVEALKKSPWFRNTAEAPIDVKKSLLEAVKSDPVEVLRARLETITIDDPELNTPLPFYGTPLHQACKRGEAEIVEKLLSAGADMEIRNTSDWTPLFTAMRFGRQNCAKVLLAHGAYVESSVFTNVTLWQYAWSYDMPDIALLLIERGAVVEKGSRFIQELLQKASDDDNLVVARRLVEAGASIRHKIDGETALQTAENSGAQAVLEYFASLDKRD